MTLSRRTTVAAALASVLVGLSAYAWTQQGPGRQSTKPGPASAPVTNPATVAAPSHALAPAAEEKHPHGVLHFHAGVGSFKILGANEVPAEGILTVDFTGTILVSGLLPGGNVQTTGTVHKEYDDAKFNKQVYFGHGHMMISGKVSAIQFFGRDVSAVFNGFGVVRLSGEFDKNLDTGTYWYEADPNNKLPWGTNMMQAPVPSPYGQTGPTPTLKLHKG